MTAADLAMVRRAMWRLYEGSGNRNVEILRALKRIEDEQEQRDRQEAQIAALFAIPPYARKACRQ